MFRKLSIAVLLASGFAAAPAAAQRNATLGDLTRPQPNDLAAQVAGTWHGDVISDARGSSRSGVTITVTRIGPNLVEVSSDYRRIPTTRIRIERAMSAIVQSGTNAVFLIEGRDPNTLSLTIDDASLSVRRH